MTETLYFYAESLVKIVFSCICGVVLGLERKTRNQVVGMRTLILISVSSTLLSILSYYMPEVEKLKGFDGGDCTRIVAGVVSGIGFLGGGAILHQGLNIKGLTSAAIIWTAASLGLALGAGLYVPSVIVLVVALFSLIALEKVEDRFFPAGKSKMLHLVFDDDAVEMPRVKAVIERHGFIVSDVNISHIMASGQLILRYTVKAPDRDSFGDVEQALRQVGSLSEFSITD